MSCSASILFSNGFWSLIILLRCVLLPIRVIITFGIGISIRLVRFYIDRFSLVSDQLLHVFVQCSTLLLSYWPNEILLRIISTRNVRHVVLSRMPFKHIHSVRTFKFGIARFVQLFGCSHNVVIIPHFVRLPSDTISVPSRNSPSGRKIYNFVRPIFGIVTVKYAFGSATGEWCIPSQIGINEIPNSAQWNLPNRRIRLLAVHGFPRSALRGLRAKSHVFNVGCHFGRDAPMLIGHLRFGIASCIVHDRSDPQTPSLDVCLRRILRMHVRCARIEREGGCLTFKLIHCFGNEFIVGPHVREIPAFAAYKIAMLPDPVVQLSR